jgi:hypothetical protein
MVHESLKRFQHHALAKDFGVCEVLKASGSIKV